MAFTQTVTLETDELGPFGSTWGINTEIENGSSLMHLLPDSCEPDDTIGMMVEVTHCSRWGLWFLVGTVDAIAEAIINGWEDSSVHVDLASGWTTELIIMDSAHWLLSDFYDVIIC